MHRSCAFVYPQTEYFVVFMRSIKRAYTEKMLTCNPMTENSGKVS